MTPYYEGGGISIFLGDCCEVSAWLTADILLTDPPYGRNWKQGELAGHTRSEASRGIANDKDTGVRDAALELWGTDRPAIVFGDLMLPPPPATKLVGVYHKTSGDSGFRGSIAGVRRDCEAVYLVGAWQAGLGGRSSVFPTRHQISGGSGVIAKSGGHPHTKPGDVLGALIDVCPDGVIADPFIGSGSTLVAARSAGRRAIGVELEERYCEMAAKRLEQGSLFEAAS